MSTARLLQELGNRHLSREGGRPEFIARLKEEANHILLQIDFSKIISNDAFHTLKNHIQGLGATIDRMTEGVEGWRNILSMSHQQSVTVDNGIKIDGVGLTAAKRHLALARQAFRAASKTNLSNRLSFNKKLPSSVLLMIHGQLGRKTGERAACVRREWRGSVDMAKALGLYRPKVLCAAAGARFTSVLTRHGVYTCGSGKGLGHGNPDPTTKELKFRPVGALEDKSIGGVSAGGDLAIPPDMAARNHTAAWTEAGELFTFGDGHFGNLGHGGTESESVPRLVEALAGKKVIGAVAARRQTAVWTEAGELFTFGDGHFGQLGHGATQNEQLPRLVEALAGNKVSGASVGAGHTVVWTKGGELFTFGNGDFGALGHGGHQHELVPRLVQAFAGKNVIGASAGQSHTLAWTGAGELFSFGLGESGGLGHGGPDDESVPRLIEALVGKQVSGALASVLHTVVWTKAGELFSFGIGAQGQLGHGGTQYESVPRLVEALAGKKVIGASTGRVHTAAWTEEGELFTFGIGLDGELGHGGIHTTTYYSAVPIQVPGLD